VRQALSVSGDVGARRKGARIEMSLINNPETKIYSWEKLSKKTRRIVPYAGLGSLIWFGESRKRPRKKETKS
jgi:hypothetical protein